MRIIMSTVLLLLYAALGKCSDPAVRRHRELDQRYSTPLHMRCSGTASCFTGCADAPGNKLRIDPFNGQTYCNLPDPVCTLAPDWSLFLTSMTSRSW